MFANYLPAESMSRQETRRSWNRIDGGYSLSEIWYDSPTGTYRSNHTHIMDTGDVIVPANEQGYHANEVIRCYSRQEMNGILVAAGYEPVDWFTRKHIDEPDYTPTAWDVYTTVVARS